MGGLKNHIQEKLKILRQLGVYMTDDERDHLRSLTSVRAVDRYARDLILRDPSEVIRKKPRAVSVISNDIPKNMYNLTEAASLFEVSRKTLCQWVDAGDLEVSRPVINNCRRNGSLVHVKDIIKCLEKHPKYKNPRLTLVIDEYLKGEK